MTRCVKCNKPLVPIGTKRKNGVSHHDDWSSRQYHKKCWKEHIDMLMYKEMFAYMGEPFTSCSILPE